MSAPPPPPVSTRIVVAATAVALLVAVAAVLAVVYLCTRPILPPPVSRPLPASTAGPAPITPPSLVECPINGCGPR